MSYVLPLAADISLLDAGTGASGLTVALMVLFSFGNGVYLQEHLNRGWEAAGARVPAVPMPAPPAPAPA